MNLRKRLIHNFVIAEALWVSAIRVSVLSCGAVLADYQSPKGTIRIHSGELYR